jgi:hypothetical protein
MTWTLFHEDRVVTIDRVRSLGFQRLQHFRYWRFRRFLRYLYRHFPTDRPDDDRSLVATGPECRSANCAAVISTAHALSFVVEGAIAQPPVNLKFEDLKFKI